MGGNSGSWWTMNEFLCVVERVDVREDDDWTGEFVVMQSEKR